MSADTPKPEPKVRFRPEPIQGVVWAKPRAKHLDEMDDDEDRPLRPTISNLFDDPEA